MNTERSQTTGWETTLSTASEMTDTLRTDGYEVTTVRAAQVIPEAPDDGETDRFGLVYVIGQSDADALQSRVSTGEFSEYEAYNRRQGDTLFVLTRIFDQQREKAVLLVGAVDLTHADRLLRAVHDSDVIYSHVQLLDGTTVCSFRHSNPAAVVPINE